MAPGGIRVIVSDDGTRSAAAAGLSAWLVRVAPKGVRGLVQVAIVSDARVRALNRRYRRRDAATDVLSFRYADAPGAPELKLGPTAARAGRAARAPELKLGPTCLGDIVIARGVARRQARMAGHDERTELRVLALHGLLHLLGYDHHTDDGAMARTERRLRQKGGLREGLIERASP